jgi:hypothetical protein
MTPSRIQDPKVAKIKVASYKTTVGAGATINIQLFEIVCFAYLKSSKLTMDTNATMGGKQNPNKKRRRMILVYMTDMHPESQLNLAPCGPKADLRTMHTWLMRTFR